MSIRVVAAGALAAVLLGLAPACGDSGMEDEAQAGPAPWTLARAMSSRRSYIAAAELAGRIYVAGGMVGEAGRPLATFQRFDPARNTWTTLPQLPEPTRAAAAATLGGLIYVVGGTTPAGDTRAVRVWDGRAWRARAPLPAARFNHSAVAVGGRVYVLGGLDGNGRETREVFAYEPRADRWTVAARLPRPLHAFGTVVFRDEIWVLGGRRGDEIVRSVDIYSPRTGRWRRGPAMPRPMELLGATVVDDEIHAIWESTYQIYDAGSGTWRQGPRPLVTRHALEAFRVGDSIYTIGGCTTQLRDSPIVERLVVSG